MCRQLATTSMPWPKVGASTGTSMKTIITSDMICAIAEPWKRSRTIATTSTRVAGRRHALHEARGEQQGRCSPASPASAANRA